MDEQANPKQTSEVGEIRKKPSKLFVIVACFLTMVCMVAVVIGGYRIGKSFKIGESTQTKEQDSKTDETIGESSNLEEDMIFKKETASLPNWSADITEEGSKGPWFQHLYMASSEDGLKFSNEKLFLEHSGVISLVLTQDNLLIATFQYFSYQNQELFDIIAYATSKDYGQTWSSIKKLQFTDLVDGANPCDPELVELNNGQLRLYFTHHPRGEKYPQLFSAISDSIDSSFLSEGVQLHTDEIILDPTVVYFNDLWHHYTLWHGTTFEYEEGVELSGIHSTSEDGLNFQLEGEIDLNMQLLGEVIVVDEGLRFYSGEKSAYSEDGYAWVLEEGTRVEGADPGIVKLPDGTYIMIYTKMEKIAE